uniref:Uncharacterized protein n=1 Tax=Daphnia galeata TaxID=27404 RepID=A0A8J2S4K1_9CRUS|nr:unnamed protein product [Daphnia galeata]
MNPRRGFTDDNLVLIHGEYYRTSDTANEKRRPILMLAWYTEFADILLGNASLGLTAESYQQLKQKGATDIVRKIAQFLQISGISVFGRPMQSAFDNRKNCGSLVSALRDLKEKRNHGIHKKIRHSHYLEEILVLMIDFCQLLQNFGMANYQSNMFADECRRQLQNLRNFKYLY